MAKKAEELGALEVGRLLDKPGVHAVGGVAGLYLQVTPFGAGCWVLRSVIGGKRRSMGLGGYPSVTLAGARAKAREARDKINQGIDPIDDGKAKRSALAAAVASALTFSEAAKKYITAQESGWKNAKHAAQWRTTLESYAYPVIGKINVGAIDTPHMVRILEPIWLTTTETASRLRGRIESVLDWATVRGFRKGENPARWRGHLEHLLPSRADVQKTVHLAAMDYRGVGAFLGSLRVQEGTGARALEFAILCAARSGEVRGATWTEFDLDAGVWTIPADRMKAKREHRVPLSKVALDLLNGLPRMAGTDLVFPSPKNICLSDMTLTAVIRRMDKNEVEAGKPGWKDSAGSVVTAHGFRSSFRDWAGETSLYPREVIEHALAHQLRDKAEAAYARGTLFDKRRSLMEDWAAFCAVPKVAANVTPIRSKAA